MHRYRFRKKGRRGKNQLAARPFDSLSVITAAEEAGRA
jgi:hypothetical protein